MLWRLLLWVMRAALLAFSMDFTGEGRVMTEMVGGGGGWGVGGGGWGGSNAT